MPLPVVLLCPDNFKGTCPAPAVAEAVAAALPHGVTADLCPLSDGGAGFLAAMTAACPELESVEVSVTGPLGAPVTARYAVHRKARYAVVEMATAAGIELVPVPDLDPRRTTTCGVGELLRHAAADVDEVLVGAGGSATNDAAVGLLQRLGVPLLLDGAAVPQDGRPLTGGDMAAVSFGALPATPELRAAAYLHGARMTVVCDVDNPMVGPRGASAVYGPQKGASPSTVAAMDAAMAGLEARMAQATGGSVRDLPGSGAAGGMVGALRAVFGAQVAPGAELIAGRVQLPRRIAAASLVVTGEGCFDGQTLDHGKTAAHVIRTAAELGKHVVVLCGRSDVAPAQLPPHVTVLSLSEDHGGDRAMVATAECITATAAKIAAHIPPRNA